MGDRWGPEGPPEEAYSRVTRDMVAVCRPFVARLDALPDELVGRYDAILREPTDEERARLTAAHPHRPLHTLVAIEPAAPGASALSLARYTDAETGATGAIVGFGDLLTGATTMCWCDACDTDAEEMIGFLEQYVGAATGGFVEYRGPQEPWEVNGVVVRPGDPDQWCLGYRSPWGGQSFAVERDSGPRFRREWAAWPQRR